MKVIKAGLFSFMLSIAFALLCVHGTHSFQKVNALGCLGCHDSSFSKGSIHFNHMNFFCEACHAGEGLDLGIVYAVSCSACHLLHEPGKCLLVLSHGDFLGCEIDGVCCLDCHLECTGKTTTLPSTSTTTTAMVTTSSTTTEPDYCVVETIYGEDSETTRFCKWVRDTILVGTPEGQKIRELYYTWSPVVVKMMEEDEDLKEKVHQLLDEILSLSEVTVD